MTTPRQPDTTPMITKTLTATYLWTRKDGRLNKSADKTTRVRLAYDLAFLARKYAGHTASQPGFHQSPGEHPFTERQYQAFMTITMTAKEWERHHGNKITKAVPVGPANDWLLWERTYNMEDEK